MSEQKYYVRLKSIIVNVSDYGDYGDYISGTDFYLDVLKEFSPNEVKHEFTKSELTEIMDGALYKQSDCLPFDWLYSREQLRKELGWEYNETIDKWEWKNQLIELVPVEEV